MLICVDCCRPICEVICLPHASPVFLALSVTFLFFVLFVNQISLGTAERICAKFTGKTRVWSLAQMSLNVKVKGQGHQRQKVLCTTITPRQRRNGKRSLQITSCARRPPVSLTSVRRDLLLSAIVRLLLPARDSGTVYLSTSSLPRHSQPFVRN